jgi:hypothetical protein
MAWDTNTPSSESPQVKPTAKMRQDHIEILRQLKAPDEIIRIAERVAAAHASAEKK